MKPSVLGVRGETGVVKWLGKGLALGALEFAHGDTGGEFSSRDA